MSSIGTFNEAAFPEGGIAAKTAVNIQTIHVILSRWLQNI